MARTFLEFLKGFGTGRDAAPEEPLRVSGLVNEPGRAIPARPEVIVTPFLADSDMPVSFADPALADVPLIYVNDAFCTLTGYAREECVGRNCRFLQGRLTRTSEASVIREGIEGEHFLLTRLLNYHRDGTPFDNALQIGQLRDTNGDVRFLFGLQWDITRTLERIDATAREDLRDRSLTPQLKMLARLSPHLVRRSIALGEGAAGVPLVERLVAMSRPYQFPLPDARPERPALRDLLRYLLAPYGHAEGESLRLDGAPGAFDAELVGPLALWLHELASAPWSAGVSAGGADAGITLSWGFLTERDRPMIAFNWNRSVVEGDPEARRHRPFAPTNLAGGNGARLMREIVEFAGGRSVTQAWDRSVDATLLLPNDIAP